MCPGLELEGWLRWFAHSSGGVECRGHAQYPVFVPNILFLLQALQKWQLDFLVSLLSLVQNLPNCACMQLFLFSTLFYIHVPLPSVIILFYGKFKKCIAFFLVQWTRFDPTGLTLPWCQAHYSFFKLTAPVLWLWLSDDTSCGCQLTSSVGMEEGIGYGSPVVASEWLAPPSLYLRAGPVTPSASVYSLLPIIHLLDLLCICRAGHDAWWGMNVQWRVPSLIIIYCCPRINKAVRGNKVRKHLQV